MQFQHISSRISFLKSTDLSLQFNLFPQAFSFLGSTDRSLQFQHMSLRIPLFEVSRPGPSVSIHFLKDSLFWSLQTWACSFNIFLQGFSFLKSPDLSLQFQYISSRILLFEISRPEPPVPTHFLKESLTKSLGLSLQFQHISARILFFEVSRPEPPVSIHDLKDSLFWSPQTWTSSSNAFPQGFCFLNSRNHNLQFQHISLRILFFEVSRPGPPVLKHSLKDSQA